MPWIPPKAPAQKGPNGGDQASEQYIRCDLCRKVTRDAYWGPKKARAVAGVWWPTGQEDQGEGIPGWCPRCASRESERARWSYHCTNLDIESVMSQYWRAPTGREWERAWRIGVTEAATGCVWEYGSTAIVGRVPPKAPPPGTSSSQAHPPEKRLAALEEEVAGLRLLEEQVAGLRLRVAELEAELEGHSSGAATGWMLF